MAICEQLGQEPDPEKMPLEVSEFPDTIQVAFFMFQFLQDRWEGMSGSYLGKDFSDFELIAKLYDIDDLPEVFHYCKRYEAHLVGYRAEQAEKRRKEAEKKAKRKASSGDTLHSIRNGE